MTEPVGNGPRLSIPANSHTSKEVSKAAVEPPEPAQKIVTGSAKVMKTPWYRRIGKNMVVDDAQSIGEYVLFSIVIPSTKNLIRDIIVGGVDRTFYGSGVRSAAPGATRGSESSIRQKYRDIASGSVTQPAQRALSYSDRASHNFENISLDSRDEALSVLDQLITRIGKYGAASVADFYDYCGITNNDYAARRWGWTDLLGSDIRQTRGGWYIVLPDPVVLPS
jgi:hypothetical protein